MGIFLGFVIGALLLGSIALSARTFLKQPKKKIQAFGTAAVAVVLLFAFVFVPFSFVKVDAGEVAVVKAWGKVKDAKTSGLYFRNIVRDQYMIYDAKSQQINLDKWCYVKDDTGTTQVVEVISTVQFRINETDASKIAVEYGSLEALKDRVTTVILGALETCAAPYTINSLVSGTGKIDYQQNIKDALMTDKDSDGKTVQERYYITFQQVTVEEFILEPELEAAMLRVRLAEAARKEREEQLKKETAEVAEKAKQDEIRAQTIREIEIANANNKVELEKLFAEAKEIEAEGDAVALIARARAEAETLRLRSIELARGLGINILKDPVTDDDIIDLDDPRIDELADYLKYIAYLEAWDGKLPEIVGDLGNIVIAP